MIKSAGYDAQQQMLEIEFANNGQIWQFDNVPEDIWYRFRSHHLPELFFHNFIMGHYPGTKNAGNWVGNPGIRGIQTGE